MLIRPREAGERWPPKGSESAENITTPEFTLNWKNNSKIGWLSGLDYGNSTVVDSGHIHWFHELGAAIATNATDFASFSLKDDPQHASDTRYVAFRLKHPYLDLFFGVRVIIPPTGPRWFEINASHDPKWYRPEPGGWGYTYASRKGIGMFKCQTQPGGGAGSVSYLTAMTRYSGSVS